MDQFLTTMLPTLSISLISRHRSLRELLDDAHTVESITREVQQKTASFHHRRPPAPDADRRQEGWDGPWYNPQVAPKGYARCSPHQDGYVACEVGVFQQRLLHTPTKPLFPLSLSPVIHQHKPRYYKKMANQKDANKRTQGASQNLPNTHFQDESLTDHDVLKNNCKTNVCKMSSGVCKTRTDVCVTICAR